LGRIGGAMGISQAMGAPTLPAPRGRPAGPGACFSMAKTPWLDWAPFRGGYPTKKNRWGGPGIT